MPYKLPGRTKPSLHTGLGNFVGDFVGSLLPNGIDNLGTVNTKDI
jgi:hypothetical protein